MLQGSPRREPGSLLSSGHLPENLRGEADGDPGRNSSVQQGKSEEPPQGPTPRLESFGDPFALRGGVLLPYLSSRHPNEGEGEEENDEANRNPKRLRRISAAQFRKPRAPPVAPSVPDGDGESATENHSDDPIREQPSHAPKHALEKELEDNLTHDLEEELKDDLHRQSSVAQTGRPWAKELLLEDVAPTHRFVKLIEPCLRFRVYRTQDPPDE